MMESRIFPVGATEARRPTEKPASVSPRRHGDHGVHQVGPRRRGERGVYLLERAVVLAHGGAHPCGGQADQYRLTAREGSGAPRGHGPRGTRSSPTLAARSGHRSRDARHRAPTQLPFELSYATEARRARRNRFDLATEARSAEWSASPRSNSEQKRQGAVALARSVGFLLEALSTPHGRPAQWRENDVFSAFASRPSSIVARHAA